MNLRIGLSALQASQYAINSISHNLANANTEGYHRQEVVFQTAQADFINGRFIGSGVEISDVRRIRDLIVESAYTNSTSDLSRVEQSLVIESRIESLISPGEGSIQNAFTGLFDEFSRLSANPGERSLRNSVLNQASNLTNRIQDVSGQFVSIQEDVRHQIELEVEALNQEIETLVDLQNRIKSSPTESARNDLADQRDQLVNRIAERVDVQRFEFVQNEMGLGLANSSISIGAAPIRFESAIDENGIVEIRVENGSKAASFSSGRIGALVDVNNSLVGKYAEKIDSFARELIANFDQIHAVGLGIDGPFQTLQSGRPVSDVSLPLSQSSPMTIEGGELFVTVNSPSGERRTTSIAIDPATDSLSDIAAKISGIENVQGIVDSETGRLSVIAKPGYRFDFTGNLETIPGLANYSGTATPTISGDYQGNQNSDLTLTAITGGSVGKTTDLKFQVTNSDGNVLKEISVGEGYEAGTPIDLGDGVSVQLAVGNISAGDSFQVVRVASSDTSNFLSAVGLNSFFSGTDASDIAVDKRILESPDSISSSKSGEIADTRNLANIIAMRDERILDDGRLTFGSFMNETNSEIGFRVQSSQSVQTSLSQLKFEYQSERDSVSGVDVNEELIQLTQHQKNYEAAIQVVRTMESMMDELFQIIR